MLLMWIITHFNYFDPIGIFIVAYIKDDKSISLMINDLGWSYNGSPEGNILYGVHSMNDTGETMHGRPCFKNVSDKCTYIVTE